LCLPSSFSDDVLMILAHVMTLLLSLPAAGGGSAGSAAQAPRESAQAVFDRAVADFRGGRVAESAAGFDALARLVPNEAPGLWQRGIALYLAGRFGDCRAQFESHRTVNPNDVENAAWHFACVARAESPAKAKAALLPVGPDSRRPMTEIYQMFRGTLTPDKVLAAAGDQANAQFYAHLYLGLYADAIGDRAQALEQMTLAASDRYAAGGGYMHTVARIHRDILQRGR
jgi:lipoprotein NlpI